jgi:hypothetical protein
LGPDTYGVALYQVGGKDISLIYYKIAFVIRKRCQNALFKTVFSGSIAQVYLGIDDFKFKNSKTYKEFHIAEAIIFGYMPLTPFPPSCLLRSEVMTEFLLKICSSLLGDHRVYS